MARASIARTCGSIVLVATIIPVVADVVSWLLADGYNPIAQSISALAVGRASWLIDVGIWSFAIGCVIAAGALFALKLDGGRWTAAVICLALVGVAAAVVAQLNEYAGQQNAGGNIHAWMVYALYPLFALAALLPLPGFRHISDGLARTSRSIGIAWLVLALIYLWVPESWSGAYERMLALIMLAWLGTTANALRHLEHDYSASYAGSRP